MYRFCPGARLITRQGKRGKKRKGGGAAARDIFFLAIPSLEIPSMSRGSGGGGGGKGKREEKMRCAISDVPLGLVLMRWPKEKEGGEKERGGG